MIDMDDLVKMYREAFGPKVAAAVVKINGTCRCSQCVVKMEALYVELTLALAP